MKRMIRCLFGIFAVISLSSTTYALSGDEVQSSHIAEADGNTGQSTNYGQGVKRGHIQDNAISKEKLADNAVSSAEIENGTVGEDDLASGSVTESKLGTGSVTESKLGTGAVTESKLGTGSVTEEKIADHSVSAVKLASEYYTKAEVDLLVNRIAALEQILERFSVSVSGDDIYITGANLNIVSGAGLTHAAVNGLGNLIVGYNELRSGDNDRSGSHNIVVGALQNYTSFGGLIAGVENTVAAPYAAVSGGNMNTATANAASVCGGYRNSATNTWSTVSGGEGNAANGATSSVSGGSWNQAYGLGASVSGGDHRYASGDADWAAGALWEDQ